jgi:hypothetical protein
MKHASMILIILTAGVCSGAYDDESVVLIKEIHQPEAIYVRPFDAKAVQRFKAAEDAALTGQLIIALQAIAPAQRAIDPLPQENLMVSGEFIEVDEGRVKAKVMIYNLARSNSRPVAYFESEASGPLQEIWQQIAADTLDFLQRKIRRSEHRTNKAKEHRDRKAKQRGEPQ